MDRLPPNQHRVASGKWPVVGERAPSSAKEPWCVTVHGLVRQARIWSLDELKSLPQTERIVDIHCVTRWSRPRVCFKGVDLGVLLDLCGILPEARYLSFVARSSRGHSTSLVLEDAIRLGVLVALEADGAPLLSEHGGSVRTVVPHRYFYKSLKWLEQIEVLAKDRLGYWERVAGYHNGADPYLEQRYAEREITLETVKAMLRNGSLAGQDLRGLPARGLRLPGLDAGGALLRDADFRNAYMPNAVFSGGNLSNARFQGAHLRGATFYEADLEGADFRGADLCGADFRRAKLLAVTFCDEPGDVERYGAAVFDGSTLFDEDALEALLPVQAAFLAARRIN
ncbi:MAG: molybdopterin-dependent oxidoreductase [Chthonomonadales bacterium]